MDDFVKVNFTNYDLIKNTDILNHNTGFDDKKYSLIENNLEFNIDKFINDIDQIEFIVKYNDIYNFCDYSIEQLTKQYEIDSIREDIYFNNVIVNDTSTLLDYFKYAYNDKLKKILMFITQTIYAYIIKYIHYSLPNNVYVGEIATKEHRMRIDININNENIQVKTQKKLRFFKIVNTVPVTIFEFNVIYDIDIDSEDFILVQLIK